MRCVVILVVIPFVWGIGGLLLIRLFGERGSWVLIPLFFYSWPATFIFGDEHFNMHAACIPADWLGVGQVVAFYTVIAVLLGISISSVQIIAARKRHATNG